MRILALENELTSMRGGQEISLLDVCRGLAGKSHQITLAYVTPGDLEDEYRRICHRMVQVRTYSIDRSRTVMSLRDFLVSLWAVRGERPDVVYANQYQDSLLAGIARRLHRTPFVCHLRLPPPDVICTQFRLGMSQTTRLIAISEQTKRDWVACGYRSDAIDVVYNGIDLNRHIRRAGRSERRGALGVQGDDLLVTYAGRLHPAKGVETLLEGFSLIAHKRPSHLVVAGRAAVMPGSGGGVRDYLGELRALAERLGIARAITWIDHQRDIADLFSASDVTVLPSLWSEPFGRVVIESMACETPVVASRVGGIAEILTGEFAEWMVTAGQPDELASRVLGVADLSAADPRIGQRARAHVASRFSVDRMIDGVEAALNVRICSISPHQLLNNPRLVREADALAAAGHDVRVIAVRNRPEQSALDDSRAHERAWRLQTIDIQRTPEGRRAWLQTGIRQKAATALWRRLRRGERLATMAYCRTATETTGLILNEPPDLIIAHTHPMLGVACLAARRLDCRWGFDCEDLLSEEYGEGISDPAHQALVRYVEATFMPRADYVTVASPEFSRWLAEHYGIREPLYVANVSSIAEAPEAPQAGYPDSRSHVSLYWFSISLGPLRGVEDAIRALPLIDGPVTLHLRGRVLPGYDRELRALIGSLNVSDRVVVHDLVPPEETVRAAAEHDIGLVLTQPCCDNHELQVPNKIYTYVLAGVAVGITATRGLRGALATMPGVGFEYQPGNHVELAERITALVREPGRLRAYRAEAFRLGRTRFNWEVEQRRLVDLVASLAPQPVRVSAWRPART